MGFIPMGALMERAYQKGYAIPAFCAWNAEVMAATLRVAERLEAPVILMQGPGEFPVLEPGTMASVARAVLGRYTEATAALHLDHGDSLELVRTCLDSGYSSVMLDFSTRSFEENTEGLAKVVELARPLSVTVEGELGHVGKADTVSMEGPGASSFTDPALAQRFVEATGVEVLAVSIGNKHGFYQGEPKLDFGLLAELRDAARVPLVLHGGTGIPPADVERAVSLGIAKVNVASELVHGLRSSLSSQWAAGRNLWTPGAIAEAMPSLEATMEKWIRITGAVGKAH